MAHWRELCRFSLIVVLVVGTWAASAQAQNFDHKGLARQVIEQHIRPGYAKLVKAAQKFDAAATTFCDGAPDLPIGPVKEAFANLVLSWSRIEHIRFGPVMEERRHARMLYWPDRKGLGRRQVLKALKQSDASVLDPAKLEAKSVALQGLGALEMLLYGKGAGDFAKPGAARQFRCGYVRAIAANLVSIAKDLKSEWQDGQLHPTIFLTPGPNNPSYLDDREVTLEIAKAFLVGLERLRDVKIAGPLGLRPKTAVRTRAAFDGSMLSTQAIAANLEGLNSLYEKSGMFERIEAHEPGMGKSILTELNQALTHLKSVSVPMSKVPVNRDAEDRFLAVGFPLKNARNQATRTLAEAAGLSLGFNALDGD